MFIVDTPNGECRFSVLWVEPQIWGAGFILQMCGRMGGLGAVAMDES